MTAHTRSIWSTHSEMLRKVRLITRASLCAIISIKMTACWATQVEQTEQQKLELQNLVTRFTQHYNNRDYQGTMKLLGNPNLERTRSVSKAITFLFIDCRRYHTCITVYWEPSDPNKVMLVARKFFQAPYISHGQWKYWLDKFEEVSRMKVRLTDQECKLFATAIEPSSLDKLESFSKANITNAGVQPIDGVDGDLWILESWDHGFYRTAVRDNTPDEPMRQQCYKLLELAEMHGFKASPSLRPPLVPLDKPHYRDRN